MAKTKTERKYTTEQLNALMGLVRTGNRLKQTKRGVWIDLGHIRVAKYLSSFTGLEVDCPDVSCIIRKIEKEFGEKIDLTNHSYGRRVARGWNEQRP